MLEMEAFKNYYFDGKFNDITLIDEEHSYLEGVVEDNNEDRFRIRRYEKYTGIAKSHLNIIGFNGLQEDPLEQDRIASKFICIYF